jgi:hypothetical protein
VVVQHWQPLLVQHWALALPVLVVHCHHWSSE